MSYTMKLWFSFLNDCFVGPEWYNIIKDLGQRSDTEFSAVLPLRERRRIRQVLSLVLMFST